MYTQYNVTHFPIEKQYFDLGLQIFTCGNLIADANYVCKPRILDDYYLIFISEGEGELTCRKKTFTLSKGHLYVLFPGLLHSYKTHSTHLLQQQWIGFNGANAGAIIDSIGLTPESPLLDVADTYDEVQKLINTLSTSDTSPIHNNALYRTGLLSQLFGLYAHQHQWPDLPSDKSRAIIKAINYIEANYKQPLNIEDVATYVSLCKSHFYTRFKKEVGTTPNGYATAFRISQARYLLIHTDKAIHDISEAIGYSDALYFSRVFKQKCGMSPSAYRQMSNTFRPDDGNKASIPLSINE